MSRRTFSPLLVLAALLLACSPAVGGGDYLSFLDQALASLERGSPRSALAPLLEAQSLDGADPLAHLALGLAYLQLGGLQEATACFTEASRWTTEGQAAQAAGPARLGAGIALLASDKLAAALTSLKQAGGAGPATACLALASLLSGDPAPAATLADGGDDAFGRMVRAAGLRATGQPEAAAVLLELQARSAVIPTFDPPCDGRVLPHLGGKSELVGEVVPLRLTLQGEGVTTIIPHIPAGLGIAYVSLQVDGRVWGMTNGLPFSFRWEPAAAGRGWHTLMVKAYTADGVMRAAGCRCVLQGEPYPGDRYDAARYQATLARLSALLRPQPHPAFVHYQLARCYEALGRRAQAIAHLEHAVAIYPQLLDARPRLLALYGRANTRVLPDLKQASRSRGGRRVALTFDDGPHPAFTPQILQALRRYRARATFFMVGMQVASFPDLARAIAADGHELANHTYTHPNLQGLGPIGVQQELLRTRVTIRAVTGKETCFFRPPGGRYNDDVRRAIGQLGYRTVLWSSNIMTPKSDDPRRIARAMLAEIGDGGIVLLHNGRDFTTDVLPILLPELTRRGYRFVTLSELLAGS